MKKYVALLLTLVLILSMTSCKNNSWPEGVPENFSFSLTWNCYGVSSYDSLTGELVKTTDATSPEDYITNYELTPEEIELIYNMIEELEVDSYPDEYDPHPANVASTPPMTLILTVRVGDTEKTITAENIAGSFSSQKQEGQEFLTVCKEIIDILTATEEWQELPEYEKHYR